MSSDGLMVTETAPSITDMLAKLLMDNVLTAQLHYFFTPASYLSVVYWVVFFFHCLSAFLVCLTEC